jgi:hypothetical protein
MPQVRAIETDGANALDRRLAGLERPACHRHSRAGARQRLGQ